MNSVLTNSLIALGIASVIGLALQVSLQNRRRRSRAGTGGDAGSCDSYSTTSDASALGSWFSSDSDAANCSSIDGGGGDCGGGGDGGGGGD